MARAPNPLWLLLVLAAAACVPPEHLSAPDRAGATPEATPLPTRSAMRTPAVTETPAIETEPSVPAPPAAPPLDPEARAIHLFWAPGVDLDLTLTGPDAVTTYFGNAEPAGARLRGDRACADDAPASETIELTSTTPGAYRVGIDFSDTCGLPTETASYRLVLDLEGTRREVAGTLDAGRFDPAALVFALPPNEGERE